MAYPPQQPHPEDPWGQQAQGAPQGHGRPGYGQPSSGQAPRPGYGPRGAGPDQGPGRPGHGPQSRQGGPPPGFGQQAGRHGSPGSRNPQGPQYPYDPPSPYDSPGPYDPPSSYGPQNPYGSQNQHGQGDPYGMSQYDYDYGLPPKRNNTLMIGLSAGLGVLLLIGGTVGAVSYFNSAGSKPAAAQPGATTSLPTTAPWQSESPSGEPSGEPTGAPSEEPTEPAVEPTDTPPTSSRAAPGSPIAHTEFDDWKFNLGGVKFDAKKVGGWTYDTCDPVDAQGVLAKNNCERAVQVAYSAYRGHLKAVQVMLSFPTDKAAKTAATRMAKLTSDPVNIRRDMALATFVYGQIRANVAKKYVIVTIVTADKTAKSKAEKFHLYKQADSVSYFLLRDLTVTS
ncbi:hypothetical protein ETD86_02365 [Nonomuraea turkmeniaca]|uniref:Uncharacterized protein n=1 Tax=Nonomuraea turkmeniaca TaxID=103838 RepID=A0A5S4FXZ6_9ACTN|nr:hypothetical protein [Nonomuraea turkmeniaca]TMR24981.1 hypothetical protein ETD86_02365 [Nonomuraea turkmeniaca]